MSDFQSGSSPSWQTLSSGSQNHTVMLSSERKGSYTSVKAEYMVEVTTDVHFFYGKLHVEK